MAKTDLEGRILNCACADEGNDDRDDVDRQLELEEFRDRVVDVATPHDGLRSKL